MARIFILLCALATAGCTAAGPSDADAAACIDAGHVSGSAGFEQCLLERRQRRFERPTGAVVDDLRTRTRPVTPAP